MAVSNKIIAAIAIIVIVVVAVAAAVVLTKGDNTPAEQIEVNGAELKVFGNVNGDMVIDSKDVKELKSLVSDKALASEYPLADANQDGVIDSKDV
ncbi:MAG: hypothetical protein IJ856_04360, partial [Candidatus Methanomethylophilaceae archaeon]|nr:hypothetical protein [Candidatus Methanomethylophilaceae archaeon]